MSKHFNSVEKSNERVLFYPNNLQKNSPVSPSAKTFNYLNKPDIMTCLVIGYGNTLRNDDGAGQIVAEKVANWKLNNLRAIAVHQLTPELAANLAEVEQIIFVDAYPACDQRTVQTYPLQPLATMTLKSHTSDPRVLLTLTETLYNHCPQAWWVLIPGVNFELGEELSPLTQNGITEALAQIQSLLNLSAL